MNDSVTAASTPEELLRQQFYDWEFRGRGWDVLAAPVRLEPAFRRFCGHFLPPSSMCDDGVQESMLGRIVKSLLGAGTARRPMDEALVEEEEPEPEWQVEPAEWMELQVALPKNYQPSREVFEQCLFSLNYCRSALAFEVVGTKGGIVAQVIAAERDTENVLAQLRAHFPEAVINRTTGYLSEQWRQAWGGCSEIQEFGLHREFMLPLASARQMATDPLVGICGALEHLQEGEAGVFQVLFQPVREPWAASIMRAVTFDDGDPFFSDAPEFLALTKQKLARPLFAAVVRVGARSESEIRKWNILRGLAGALSLFAHPAGNELVPLDNDDYPTADHEQDLLSRCTRRSGMLINSDELVSLAHLPTAAVRSRRLMRVLTRTKEPPPVAMGSGIVLGENAHEGRVTAITLKPEQRVQHMHVIGASGTGKSTLLLNLICQDMEQGHGLGVFDPHGDLIDQILARVPPERESDVILFDPSDEEHPIGFNVLSAHSNVEKNLLASDLVAVFRRLSTSWGDQMNSVLGNAILAFLESPNGGTVADLRRFLLEPGFRKEFLQSVQDPDVVYYWEHGFPILKANSVGPLLTRLDTFLRPKAIRYMVGQRVSKLDFGAMLNESKIFLARLPQGIIGEENAFLLGALLVAKFHQLAISRQGMEAGERRPFYLYLDEFQNFATPSMATILSGVRKYQLGLVLAHHELRQLQRADELASAVLSHPYTRICFRLGDDDARKLAEGFSFFEADDLRNLSRGEAICRMERADFDFNLRTLLPAAMPEQTAKERRNRLRQSNREQYGTSRESVEVELARSRTEPPKERVDPFVERTAQAECTQAPAERERPVASPEKPHQIPPPAATPTVKPAPPKPPRPGRGGEEHVHLQTLTRQLAVGMNFEVDVEKGILDNERSVDVFVKKGDKRFAFEMCVTTGIRYELGKVRTYRSAGFDQVVLVCSDASKLDKLREAALRDFAPEEQRCLRFCLPDGISDVLIEFSAMCSSRDTVSHGRKTKVTFVPLNPEEARKRRGRLAEISTNSLKRLKRQ